MVEGMVFLPPREVLANNGTVQAVKFRDGLVAAISHRPEKLGHSRRRVWIFSASSGRDIAAAGR